MQGQYKFTGNPRIAMYQPRGLEYFSYLPTLKAKVKGAAIAKAEEMNFNYTGLAPQDLEPAKAMNEYITTSKDTIVNDLMGGESVTDATVDKLFKLAGNKRENNEKMNIALNNAKARQKYRDGNDHAARTTNNYEYYNKLNEVADEQFGSTFLADGSTKEFDPEIPVGYVDLMGNLKQRLATAMPELSEPGRLSQFVADNIDVQTIVSPSGQEFYKAVYKKPMDKWSNRSGIDKVLTDFNLALDDENTEEGAFAKFMGPEYMKQFSQEYMEDIRDTYLRTDLRAGQYGMMDLGRSADPNAKGNGFNRDNPFAFNTEVIESKDPIIIMNQDTIDEGGTPTDFGVSAVINIDQDPENSTANIVGLEDYKAKVDQTTKFLFGDGDLSMYDLMQFAKPLNAEPTAGYNRYDNNYFALKYRQALDNGDSTALKLNRKIGELNDLMEAASPDDLNAMYAPLDFTVDPSAYVEELKELKEEARLRKSTADRKHGKSSEKGMFSTLWSRRYQEDQRQTSNTSVSNIPLNEIDELKAEILEASSELYNNQIANNLEEQGAYYDYGVDTLYGSIKSDGSSNVTDLYDTTIKPQLEQSIGEGAQSMIFDLKQDSKQLEFITGSNENNLTEVGTETLQAINHVPTVEGLEGRSTNVLHPTILGTRPSLLLGENYFKGTPEEIKQQKAEIDNRYKDAFVFKVPEQKDARKWTKYVVVENKLNNMFGGHKMETVGYVLHNSEEIPVDIRDVINGLPMNGSARVALAPGMELQYKYTDGGRVYMTRLLDGQPVGRVEQYADKQEAEENLRPMLRKMKQPQTE